MPAAPSAIRDAISLRVHSSPNSTGLTAISPANRPLCLRRAAAAQLLYSDCSAASCWTSRSRSGLAPRLVSSSIRSASSLVSAISGTIMVVAMPAWSMIGSACSIVPSHGPWNSSAFIKALVALADG
jgi:hypothetical protein